MSLFVCIKKNINITPLIFFLFCHLITHEASKNWIISLRVKLTSIRFISFVVSIAEILWNPIGAELTTLSYFFNFLHQSFKIVIVRWYFSENGTFWRSDAVSRDNGTCSRRWLVNWTKTRLYNSFCIFFEFYLKWIEWVVFDSYIEWHYSNVKYNPRRFIKRL
jgi:hypothetical protein